MIAVVQRVTAAKVVIETQVAGEIKQGLAVLAAIVATDTDADLKWAAARIAGLRVFPSEKGGYDLDVRQIGGKILLVSNFTVAGDTSSGRRPGWSAAMSPDAAKPVFDRFVEMVRAEGVEVATGEFGADMEVTIVNDGPLTVIVDSKRKAER
jgi:D-tyrosyl-tRNA(Tyr) deacylase